MKGPEGDISMGGYISCWCLEGDLQLEMMGIKSFNHKRERWVVRLLTICTFSTLRAPQKVFGLPKHTLNTQEVFGCLGMGPQNWPFWLKSNLWRFIRIFPKGSQGNIDSPNRCVNHQTDDTRICEKVLHLQSIPRYSMALVYLPRFGQFLW